jgi:hypothetical protein
LPTHQYFAVSTSPRLTRYLNLRLPGSCKNNTLLTPPLLATTFSLGSSISDLRSARRSHNRVRHVHSPQPVYHRKASFCSSAVDKYLAHLELQQHILAVVHVVSTSELANVGPAATFLWLHEPADTTPTTAPRPAKTSQFRVQAKSRGCRPDCCRDYKLSEPDGAAQRGCKAGANGRCHARH